MSSDKIPNVLVVGVAKSGTTTIFQNLKDHPQVFIPERKECRFFSEMPRNFIGPGSHYPNDTIENFEDYKKLFHASGNAKIRGDISNDYFFYYKKSVANILKYLGNKTKIIVVLRNPVQRAFSNYLQGVTAGNENLSFEAALQEEENRIRQRYSWTFYYKSVSTYAPGLEHYLRNFDNVKVYLFEELFSPSFYDSLQEFLEIDNILKVDPEERFNATGIAKSKSIHHFLYGENSNLRKVVKPVAEKIFNQKVRRKFVQKLSNWNLSKPEINEETKSKLIAYFKNDIEKVESLINKDLSKWKYE